MSSAPDTDSARRLTIGIERTSSADSLVPALRYCPPGVPLLVKRVKPRRTRAPPISASGSDQMRAAWPISTPSLMFGMPVAPVGAYYKVWTASGMVLLDDGGEVVAEVDADRLHVERHFAL